MNKIKNILLATPPYHAGVVECAGIWPPLGLAYIAGELRRHGYDVEIYDSMSMQHTLDDVRNYLRSKNYDVIGLSTITASVVASLEMLKISREEHPHAVNVMGNVHPTFMYEELFEQNAGLIDIIVRDEGETTMTALMNGLNDGINLNNIPGLVYLDKGKLNITLSRPFINDLDSLQPAWDLLDWNLYKYFVIADSRLGIVNSSRGCSHDCSFCSQQKFWQKSYRELSPSRLIEQLKLLRSNYGVNVVMLSDEYPTKNRDRWEEILDMLIWEQLDVTLLMETRVEDILRDSDVLWKYRKANIVHIYVGVEATNQASLDLFKKDIKCEQSQETLRLIAAHGMVSECSLVLGMPDETPETIQATLELAKHYNPDFAHFLAIAPWPYADIYPQVKDYIRIKDYSQYNLVTPIVEPKQMTLEEVNDAIIQCYKDFYMWKAPQFINEKNDFRRNYLLTSTKVMMKNSFLQKYLKGFTVPSEMRQLRKSIQPDLKKVQEV